MSLKSVRLGIEKVNLVLNLDPAERNRKSMMSYLTEYIREVPLSSKAKQSMARNYAFHLQVRLYENRVFSPPKGNNYDHIPPKRSLEIPTLSELLHFVDQP